MALKLFFVKEREVLSWTNTIKIDKNLTNFGKE